MSSEYYTKLDMPCRYTGAEPSPKGLGHCAHLTRLGAIMRGRDGELWQVKMDINSRKLWRRITIAEAKGMIKKRVLRRRVDKIIKDVERFGTARDHSQAELRRCGYVTLSQYLRRFPKREHKRRRKIYMDIPLRYLKK